MRYRLRTLLIVLALGRPVLAESVGWAAPAGLGGALAELAEMIAVGLLLVVVSIAVVVILVRVAFKKSVLVLHQVQPVRAKSRTWFLLFGSIAFVAALAGIAAIVIHNLKAN